MKKFSQIVSEAKKQKFASETEKKEHFMHHATEAHKYMDDDSHDPSGDKLNHHLNEIEKHHGRKVAGEIQHAENDERSRSKTYDHYAK